MTISNTLNNAWQNLRNLSRENPVFASFLFLICSIPLPLFFSSISLGIFAATCLYWVYKQKNFHFSWTLFLPIALYLLMAISLFWSIDVPISKKALSKELTLAVIPICFFLFGGFTSDLKQQLLRYFSYFMSVFGAFSLVRALIRFVQSGDKAVFFYHELVTEMVNAIHVSVYFALALIWFLTSGLKTWFSRTSAGILLVCLFLLSSKNVIVVFGLLCLIYLLIRFRKNKKMLWSSLGIIAITGVLFSGLILERFSAEINTVNQDSTINKDFTGSVVYNKSLNEAWNNEQFTPNDYFPGTALRVLQARFFFELLEEDDIFWTGYGLNASYGKIEKKVAQYNLYEGYSKFNFHNQYIQNFADLGIFGFLLLVVMLIISVFNGIRKKDFVHITFTFLMISLFLTESFLWRQRGVTFFVAVYCLFNSIALIPGGRRNT